MRTVEMCVCVCIENIEVISIFFSVFNIWYLIYLHMGIANNIQIPELVL